MITRIVKMHFEPGFITLFKEIFEKVQPAIAASAGCQGVTLLQDAADKNIFFTISRWEDEAALNIYRDSVLFKETWQIVKANFSEKPAAWSLNTVI